LCDVDFGHGFWTPTGRSVAGEWRLSQKPTIVDSSSGDSDAPVVGDPLLARTTYWPILLKPLNETMLAKDNERSPQPDLDRYAQAGCACSMPPTGNPEPTDLLVAR
jgi:hypothetical protein